MKSDVLKSKGNEAFLKRKFHDALQYYTEGIRACSEGDIVCKLLGLQGPYLVFDVGYGKQLLFAKL
jgi:hypothetical protein